MGIIHVDQKSTAKVQDGSVTSPFITIKQAAKIAKPGDTVLVNEGVYREHVMPECGGEQGKRIIYKAAEFGKVVIKGSNVFTGSYEMHDEMASIYSVFLAKEEYGDTFYTPLADTFTIPEHYEDWTEEQQPKMVGGLMHYGDRSKYPTLSLGQVFVNGENLYEKTNLHALYSVEKAWFFDKLTGMLYVRCDNLMKADNIVELTARNRCFASKKRGLGYITVERFVFSHCGNQFPASFWNTPENAQAGAIGTRSGHHWHIKNNVISHIKCIGVDIGSEIRDCDDIDGIPGVSLDKIRNHVVENNRFYDIGACAITGLGHYNTIVANNYIEKSNSLNFSSPETAGIKFHYCIDADIYGNTVIDSNCDGIWLDNIYTGSKVHHNNLIRCGNSGIFIELGEGPVEVNHNFVYQTRPGLYGPDPKGSGIYTHDAEGIHMHNNVVSSSAQFGLYLRVVTNRWCGADNYGENAVMNTANCLIENNTLLNNNLGEICMPNEGPRAYNNVCRNNVISENGEMVISGFGDFDEENPEVMERNVVKIIDDYEERYGEKPKLWLQNEKCLGIIVTQEEFENYYQKLYEVKNKRREQALYEI